MCLASMRHAIGTINAYLIPVRNTAGCRALSPTVGSGVRLPPKRSGTAMRFTAALIPMALVVGLAAAAPEPARARTDQEVTEILHEQLQPLLSDLVGGAA